MNYHRDRRSLERALSYTTVSFLNNRIRKRNGQDNERDRSGTGGRAEHVLDDDRPCPRKLSGRVTPGTSTAAA